MSIGAFSDYRLSGLKGAATRWGPPRRLTTGDLPPSERAALCDLLARVRARRAARRLDPGVSDPAIVAELAATLDGER
jgi:hypothetical protein